MTQNEEDKKKTQTKISSEKNERIFYSRQPS